MSQTHLAGGALFTAAGLGAASAAGWMHAPVWALALGIAWGALAGELPDIDHRRARVSRAGAAFGVAGALLGDPRADRRRVHPRAAGQASRAHPLAHLSGAVGGDRRAVVHGVRRRYRARAGLGGGKLAAIAHTGAPMCTSAAVPWLLGYLAVVYPYAVVTTALGYVSHLVLDSLTGPIPWGWPFAARRVALAPAALRIRTGSRDRDLAAAAGDHRRCRHRGSRGRGTTAPSALTWIACHRRID